MSDDSPPDGPASEPLAYRDAATRNPRDELERRPLSPEIGYGLLAAIVIICIATALSGRMLPYLVACVAGTLAAIGAGMSAMKRWRLPGIGILLAVAAWLLLMGSCWGINKGMGLS